MEMSSVLSGPQMGPLPLLSHGFLSAPNEAPAIMSGPPSGLHEHMRHLKIRFLHLPVFPFCPFLADLRVSDCQGSFGTVTLHPSLPHCPTPVAARGMLVRHSGLDDISPLKMRVSLCLAPPSGLSQSGVEAKAARDLY